jgi:hypothetical protein
MRVGWKVFWVLVVTLFACLALWWARRPVERMERRIGREPWKCGLVGLAAQILLLPVVALLCIVLAISVIGIPVLLIMPFVCIAMAAAVFFGFVAVARHLGRWVERRFGWTLSSPYAELLCGLGVIYALSLIGRLLDVGPLPLRILAGMFLFAGFLLWYASLTVGFGAAVLTRFGTAESWHRQGLPPVPPIPALGEEGAYEPPRAEDEWPAESERPEDES